MGESIFTAHNHSSFHRDEVLGSKFCSCFHCLQRFSPDEIEEWTDNGQTALCPKCNVDSVIGDRSGLKLDTPFLREMHDYWFS